MGLGKRELSPHERKKLFYFPERGGDASESWVRSAVGLTSFTLIGTILIVGSIEAAGRRVIPSPRSKQVENCKTSSLRGERLSALTQELTKLTKRGVAGKGDQCAEGCCMDGLLHASSSAKRKAKRKTESRKNIQRAATTPEP